MGCKAEVRESEIAEGSAHMSILSLVRSRLFIAALVVGLALIVVAACNGDDDGDGGDADEAEDQTQVPVVATIRLEQCWYTDAVTSLIEYGQLFRYAYAALHGGRPDEPLAEAGSAPRGR